MRPLNTVPTPEQGQILSHSLQRSSYAFESRRPMTSLLPPKVAESSYQHKQYYWHFSNDRPYKAPLPSLQPRKSRSKFATTQTDSLTIKSRDLYRITRNATIKPHGRYSRKRLCHSTVYVLPHKLPFPVHLSDLWLFISLFYI